MIGPDDLSDLDAPEVLYRSPDDSLRVELSKFGDGGYYEITLTRDVGTTVEDLIAGLMFIPKNSLVRDAFGYREGVCVNFWVSAV